MATFTINGQVIYDNGMKYQGVLSNIINATSSYGLAEPLNLNSGSWTPLNFGSATDVRYLFMDNPNVTASVFICSNTSSIQYTVILQPGDTALIPYSGSNSYWALNKQQPTGSLQYIIVPA